MDADAYRPSSRHDLAAFPVIRGLLSEGSLDSLEPPRYGILGPVLAYRADRALPIGGLKQRTLLAVLLLNPNRVVPIEQLIDKLWPDRSPPSARNLVQGYVSDLRRTLAQASPGGSPLVTYPSGYSLRLERDQLDALRFEQLVEESRTARAGHETQRAVNCLRQAISLWRGPALTGTSPGALRGEAVRLEESRVAALENRIELELELGLHDQVIGELAALHAEHPLRERPVALLMIALTRSGRPAEALAVYREARRSLVEEHGLDPGASLQRLELAILKSDPSLEPRRSDAAAVLPATAVPAGTSDVRGVDILPRDPRKPHPVPPSNRAALPTHQTKLIGRDDELARLVDLLLRARLVTVTGPGGVGKTRLAVEAARATASTFDGGVTLVDLSAVRDPALIAGAVADAMRLHVPNERPAGGAVTDRLSNGPHLLVLDTFEHVIDGAIEIEELVAACPDLHVVVTSRAPLRVPGERRLLIAPLTAAAAMQLFMERAAALRPAVADSPSDRDLMARICGRLDGLPLALELAAAQLAILEPAELSAHLDSVLALPVAAPRDQPARHRTMHRTNAWAYELLRPDQCRLLRRLAVFEGSWTLDDATAVCEPDQGDRDRTRRCLEHLSSLIDLSLVVHRHSPYGTRFAMLETTRAYALERLVESGEECAARDRHAAHFASVADRAWQKLSRRDQVRWLQRIGLGHEVGNLRAALAWASARPARARPDLRSRGR